MSLSRTPSPGDVVWWPMTDGSEPDRCVVARVDEHGSVHVRTDSVAWECIAAPEILCETREAALEVGRELAAAALVRDAAAREQQAREARAARRAAATVAEIDDALELLDALRAIEAMDTGGEGITCSSSGASWSTNIGRNGGEWTTDAPTLHALLLAIAQRAKEVRHAYFDEDARSWVAEIRRFVGQEWTREAIVCDSEESARFIVRTGQLPRHFGR